MNILIFIVVVAIILLALWLSRKKLTTIGRNIRHKLKKEPDAFINEASYLNFSYIHQWDYSFGQYMTISQIHKAYINNQGIIICGCFTGSVGQFAERIARKERHPLALKYYTEQLAKFRVVCNQLSTMAATA